MKEREKREGKRRRRPPSREIPFTHAPATSGRSFPHLSRPQKKCFVLEILTHRQPWRSCNYGRRGCSLLHSQTITLSH